MCKLRRPNAAGQAILEYLLLITIILVIIGGIIYQFNDAFRIYANALFVGKESYLGCMIINGIIPGGQSEGVTCDAPQFNLASGHPKNAIGGNQGGAGNGGPNGGGSGRASEGINGRNVGLNSADQVGFRSLKNRSQGASSGKNSQGSSNPVNTGNTGFSSSSVPYGGQAPGSTSISGTGPTRFTGQKEEGEGHSKEPTRVAASAKGKGGLQLGGNTTNRATQKLNGEDTSFSFSYIFKILFIVLLLFAIIFFIGSQVVAVSRGKKR